MVQIERKEVRNPLARYVRKISVFTCSRSLECKHRLIPSGSTYLSYNHKDIPSYFHKKSITPKERLQITGPKTNQNIYVEYGSELLQILVEFTPSGFYYLFHESPSRHLNELIKLSHFEQLEIVQSLSSKLGEAGNPDELIDILQDYLIERSYQALPFCSYIEEGIKAIETSIEKILVKELAKTVNKSERQFSRQFIKIVGVSPKVYSKILQLHYAINLMQKKELSSFKEISYSANFYDLSHFDHRFK